MTDSMRSGSTEGLTARTRVDHSRSAAIALALVLAVTATVAAYVYAGAPVAIASVCTWGGALVGWLMTTFHRPLRRPAAFNLYVCMLVALMALYAEEWYWRMPSRLLRTFPRAFPAGVGISDHAFVAVFPLAGSGLLLLGALAYYSETQFGQFAAWLTFSWGCVAALAVYPLVLAGPSGYVGGTVTAPVTLLIALVGVRRLIRADAATDAHPVGDSAWLRRR